jgi:ADP-ribose pyrophosphatase YjhB (NUDIX family)
VRAIARTGLHYSTDPFDRERYQRLLDLAMREYAERTDLAEPAVRSRFAAEVGYQTARVGCDGAVFDPHDRLLLVKRADDQKWGLIAGWVEPNEHPESAMVREFAEEVGLAARIDELVGVHFRPAAANEHPHGTVSVLYLCSIISGALRIQPHEVLDVAYRDVDSVARNEWHHHHEELARTARDAHWRRRAGV